MAITVPRVSGPSVGLNPIQGGEQRVRMDANPFGDLAAVTNKIAAVVQNEQERADNARLMEADAKLSEWENNWFDPQNANGVSAYKGSRALQLNEAMLPDYDKTVSQLESGLNDRQREAFKQAALRRKERLDNRLIGVMTSENEQYQRQSFTFHQERLISDASDALMRGDKQAAGSIVGEAIAAQRSYAAQNNIPAEQAQVMEQKTVSTLHTRQILSQMSTNPNAALDYYTQNKDRMTADDRMDVESRLAPTILDEDARQTVNSWSSGSGGAVYPNGARTESEAIAVADASLSRTTKLEGTAANPNSSAVGVGQFVDETWLETLYKARPDIWPAGVGLQEAINSAKAGKNKSSIPAVQALLDKKTDKNLAMEMTRAYSRENATGLFRAGLPVTEQTVYLAHHFGLGGAKKIINAAPDTPIKNLLSAQDYNANPYLKDKTVSQVLDNHQQRAGDGQRMDFNAMRQQAETESNSLRRKNLIAEIDRQERNKNNAEADSDRNLSTSAWQKIENADPRLPIRSVLSQEEFAFMAGKGWIDSLETRQKQRAEGVETTSNYNVMSSLQETIYKASMGDEVAQTYVRRLNAYDPTLGLSQKDRDWLAKNQMALMSGDKKKVAAVATEGEIGGLISQYRRNQLGISDASLKTSPEKQLQVQAFDQAMRTWVSQYSEKEGRKPSYTEVMKKADELTMKAPVVVAGKFWGSTETQAPVISITKPDQIPEKYRADIADALKAKGMPLTDSNIIRLYQGAAQQGLLK